MSLRLKAGPGLAGDPAPERIPGGDVLQGTVPNERSFPMAHVDRDTTYRNDGVNRTVHTRETNSTGWFVGIIVALALLAIGYLVFSANSGPSTSTTTVNNTPAIESPVTDPSTTTPMTEAPAVGTQPAPATEAPPATEAAPVTETPAPAPTAPATGG